MHDNITSIGRSAFSRCFNLKSIHIPENLKIMSDGVLSWCCSLKSVNIPDKVTIIERKRLRGAALVSVNAGKVHKNLWLCICWVWVIYDYKFTQSRFCNRNLCIF